VCIVTTVCAVELEVRVYRETVCALELEVRVYRDKCVQ
jgi:hypothetical protein